MSKKPRVAIVGGTRPEIIKLAPLIFALRASQVLEPVLIATGQHREMADQAFRVFHLAPDYDLKLMQGNQQLNDLLARAVQELGRVFCEANIHGVIVQGDTTSALAASLAAFHLRLPVAHVEAGLRTRNPYSPFPEEMNRTLISRIAAISFAPTERAATNLRDEGITEGLSVTGNTIVDAVTFIASKLDAGELSAAPEVQSLASAKFILVTGHRRENFDVRLKNLCAGLRKIIAEDPTLEIVYPVHLNPHVQSTVLEMLGKTDRVHLLEPVDYPSMIFLMRSAFLIVSDSGGIQEEAPTFGKRVLVTRDSTERPELIESGLGRLISLDDVGDFETALREELVASQLHSEPAANPFGDGQSALRIRTILEASWNNL